ncbi:class I SAM-dependent methyltransferase [Dehalococcoides sp. THU3]|uniref:class I SAM-dependent methyltransferase n=1 Tax=Dehalococcoides TaxID=61434 RepID=UPI0005B56FD8|nr:MULTISPECIES: class I SAM-dependent methyltransferase [Dehalococcoides]QYY58496.1 class I SAM-dependent methyltransferase [Dehalococcoides mccartyi]BAQ34200.1 putative methyltransferase [Dehalococcoides sp. UCH007]
MSRLFVGKLLDLSHRYGGYIPLSRLSTVSRWLGNNGESVLDIGCGSGSAMLFLNRRQSFDTCGIDINPVLIADAKSKSSHRQYFCQDILKLNLADRSYDTVICLELIEHLPKDDGLNLILRLERIARKKVILSTPVGYSKVEGKNPEDGSAHQCGYLPSELRGMGYLVRGNRLRLERPWWPYLLKHSPALASVYWVFWLVMGVVFSPLAYFFPDRIASGMVCLKEVGCERKSG